MKDKLICARPFQEFQIMDNGEVYGCCPPWVNRYVLGNILTQSYDEIWNGEKAKKFRESIHDGSFRFCNEKSCPLLKQKIADVMTVDELLRKGEASVIWDIMGGKTELTHSPLYLQFCYDKTCNLSCPSCREKVIVINGEQKEAAEHIHEQVTTHYLKDAVHITITPSGDAFASALYRTFLQTLTKEMAPNLKNITILTNGLLLKKFWHTLSDYAREKIGCISVSIDSVTKGNYEVLRRGGVFEDLLENLQFIKDNIRVNDFSLSTVIQKTNYKEFYDFIAFGESYGINGFQFQILEPDFHFGKPWVYKWWIENAVHEDKNPLYQDFVNLITKNKIKTGIRVDYGPLYTIINGGNISQSHLVYEEYLKKYPKRP